MHCSVMKPYLVLSLLLVSAAVVSVDGNSEVKERRSPYPCCEIPTFEINQHSETTWSTNNMPFAVSNGASTTCRPPCVKIEGGRMTVDECVNITATMVSANENGVAAEERIYYYGQPCSDSPSSMTEPGNQGGSRATGGSGSRATGGSGSRATGGSGSRATGGFGSRATGGFGSRATGSVGLLLLALVIAGLIVK